MRKSLTVSAQVYSNQSRTEGSQHANYMREWRKIWWIFIIMNISEGFSGGDIYIFLVRLMVHGGKIDASLTTKFKERQ